MIVTRLPRLVIRSPRQREPDFRVARREHLRRHHAKDRVGLIAEVHRASEHIRVARKKPGPHSVADDADHRPTHAVFFLRKHAPVLRIEPDHFEEIGGDQGPLDLLRRSPFEPA
jgi:hypothetical protein